VRLINAPVTLHFTAEIKFAAPIAAIADVGGSEQSVFPPADYFLSPAGLQKASARITLAAHE
jgi:hypothetical protein